MAVAARAGGGLLLQFWTCCPLHARRCRSSVRCLHPASRSRVHCHLLVPQVQEYFGDWVALEGHHFLVPLPRPHLVLQPFAWDFGNSSDAIARMTEGVAALMLSLRRRFLIRWARPVLGSGQQLLAQWPLVGRQNGIIRHQLGRTGPSLHGLHSSVVCNLSSPAPTPAHPGAHCCAQLPARLRDLRALCAVAAPPDGHRGAGAV